jgi:hypothetical protein
VHRRHGKVEKGVEQYSVSGSVYDLVADQVKLSNENEV